MGLHDRISKQNGNGAAGSAAERPAALAGPVDPRRAPRLIPGRGTPMPT